MGIIRLVKGNMPLPAVMPTNNIIIDGASIYVWEFLYFTSNQGC